MTWGTESAIRIGKSIVRCSEAHRCNAGDNPFLPRVGIQFLASADSIGALQFAYIRNYGVQFPIGGVYLRHRSESPMVRLHAQSNAMPVIASAPNAPPTRTVFFFADERRPTGVVRPLSRRDLCFLRFRFPIGSSFDVNPNRAQARAIAAHASISAPVQ
jgi:hypothetical protein